MTVRGKAGVGKSALINAIVSAVKKKFESKNVTTILAPTGAAAFTANGVTIHRHFMLQVNGQDYQTDIDNSATKVQTLTKRHCSSILLIIDERSMLDSDVLARIEKICRSTAHSLRGSDLPDHNYWGKVPVVFLIGDDCQLSAINSRAIDAMNCWTQDGIKHTTHRNNQVARGQEIFFAMGKKVMDLHQIKQQDEADESFLQILDGLRAKGTNKKDSERLYR